MVVAGGVNFMQRRYTYTYNSHWWLYVPVLVAAGSLVVLMLPELMPYIADKTGVFLLLSMLTVYFLVEFSRSVIWSAKNYYKNTSLPTTYQGLLQPKISGSITKVADIFFQDVTALAIIILLLSSLSLTMTTLVFVLVVFTIHIPGLLLFGRVYGGVFLVFSTGFAFFIPYLIQSVSFGWHIMYIVHSLMYPVMMLLMILIKKISK